MEVNNRYTVDGRTFNSARLGLRPKSFSDYGAAARQAGSYRSGASAICYVNSSAPAEAVLDRGNLFFPLLVLFPLIFVTIGAGGIYFTWWGKSATEEGLRPISDRAVAGAGSQFVLIFFSIFLLIGCGLLYAFLLRPVSKVASAARWPSVPCVVLSSEIKTHHGDDGNTYSVNILYSYDFNGRELKANRYSFMGGSSSGYNGKIAIVARHPPGTETVCFVNPNDPTEAVLERGLTAEMWFGLIPLVFAVVGGGGLVLTLRKGRENRPVTAGMGRNVAFGGVTAGDLPALRPGGSAETLMLKPKVSPLVKLLGIVAIALFWNGIVSVFVAQVIRGWGQGHIEWFLAIFLIPFVLIGLALIAGIVYTFLGLFNPRPRLRVTPGAVPLGGPIEVEWEIHGRINVMRSLELRVEGREEATYRRGTNTATDRSTFASIEIANVKERIEMRSGTRVVTIPPNLMHSFASKNNKIVWVIRVRGDIPKWPDASEEFPLTVLPATQPGQHPS